MEGLKIYFCMYGHNIIVGVCCAKNVNEAIDSFCKRVEFRSAAAKEGIVVKEIGYVGEQFLFFRDIENE